VHSEIVSIGLEITSLVNNRIGQEIKRVGGYLPTVGGIGLPQASCVVPVILHYRLRKLFREASHSVSLRQASRLVLVVLHYRLRKLFREASHSVSLPNYTSVTPTRPHEKADENPIHACPTFTTRLDQTPKIRPKRRGI
jgi:hypothetical protein